MLKRKKFTYQHVSGSLSHCFRHHLEIQEQSVLSRQFLAWPWNLASPGHSGDCREGCVALENPTELPAMRAGHPGEQLTYKCPWSHCSWPVQLFKNIHLGLEGRLFPRSPLPWIFKCLPLDDLQRKLMTWSCQKKEGFSEGTEVVFSTQHARSPPLYSAFDLAVMYQ